jgi:hypothetical protein
MGTERAGTKPYFVLLSKVMDNHNLLNQPGRIFIFKEKRLQLNNTDSEEVIAKKFSKVVVPQLIQKVRTGLSYHRLMFSRR